MPFVCAGHPSGVSTGEMLKGLEGAGASIVEIGIPFSDPIADGPIIASAMHGALGRGVTPHGVFKEVERVRGSVGVGLVAMVSVSIALRVGGAEDFARRAASAGFDGVIYPDLPLEEAGEYLEAARSHGLTATLLVAPTTPADRAARIVEACSGFVYLLARTGITGERTEAPEVSRRVAKLREMTELPIACGFGIATAEHVRAVVSHADAAIVGSALVKRIDAAVASGVDPVEAASAFTRSLAEGLVVSGGSGHTVQ